jgi:hypothetical protein
MTNESPQSEQAAPVWERGRFMGAFLSIALVLGFLFAGDLYLLNKLSAARRSILRLQNELHSQIRDVRATDEQLTSRFAALEQRETAQIDALRKELDVAAQRLGSDAGQTLDRARAMVAQLQQEQRHRVDDLEQQLTLKADDGDLDDLSQDLASNTSDLRSTQRTIGELAKDLGTARSELSVFEAKSRGAFEALQKVHDREYREFDLVKNKRVSIYGIGLVLKKVNLKRRRFSLELLVNDQTLRNDDQNVGEPILFYPPGSYMPCEIVATWIDGQSLKGYLSIPKTLAQLPVGPAGS